MGYYNLNVSERAEQDILTALDYYDNINSALGARFLKELYEVYEILAENPQLYSYISIDPANQFRDIQLKSFPYLVIFEIVTADVFITAVMHTHRKPFFE